MVLTAPWAERPAGAVCLALSLLVFLPIPFANLLPSIGIMLFGFAILERDGLVAVAALALACVCFSLCGGVAAAVATAAAHALVWSCEGCCRPGCVAESVERGGSNQGRMKIDNDDAKHLVPCGSRVLAFERRCRCPAGFPPASRWLALVIHTEGSERA
jgi:hypothetical protein